MSALLASVRSFVVQHRFRTEVVGVSLLALAVFVVVGVQARRALQPARSGVEALRVATSEVAAFRSAFQAGTPEHDKRLAATVDSLGVAIVRDDRVGTVQRIIATAEGIGLRAVTVRFGGADSAALPVAPDLVRASVGVADYTLAISCRGDLAAVLSLINRLPAAVALQRIAAVRENGATRYDVVLAVFETTAARVGSVGSQDGPRG
jgi:hypothetical protein